MEEIVLLLEDADPAARILASLQAAGYRTVLYSDAASGLEALKAGTPDLVLLDAALPLPAPLELLPEVLGATQAPVIALAAGLSPGGAARLLDGGADDCLPYPPDPEELSARVRRSLRRSRPQSAACLQWRDITLSPSSRRVTRAGQAQSAKSTPNTSAKTRLSIETKKDLPIDARISGSIKTSA